VYPAAIPMTKDNIVNNEIQISTLRLSFTLNSLHTCSPIVHPKFAFVGVGEQINPAEHMQENAVNTLLVARSVQVWFWSVYPEGIAAIGAIGAI